MKASELESKGQGPKDCEKSCQDLGMRMVAMVLVSDQVPGCVCQPLFVAPAAAAAAPASQNGAAETGTAQNGAAAAVAGEVVIAAAASAARQEQLRQQQQQQHIVSK